MNGGGAWWSEPERGGSRITLVSIERPGNVFDWHWYREWRERNAHRFKPYRTDRRRSRAAQTAATEDRMIRAKLVVDEQALEAQRALMEEHKRLCGEYPPITAQSVLLLVAECVRVEFEGKLPAIGTRDKEWVRDFVRKSGRGIAPGEIVVLPDDAVLIDTEEL